MIYLYNATYTVQYPIIPTKANDVLWLFPENTATEIEVVELLKNILLMHVHYPERNVYIKTNALLVFNYFRVAIKEHLLDASDFEVRFYNGEDDPILIHVDEDGRCDHWPEGFLDTQRELLRRLM